MPINLSNPLFGSLFNLLMSGYGGAGSDAGYGERPSNVEGPSMAGGGFYSQPQGVLGSLYSASGRGGSLPVIAGRAAGTYLGGPIGGVIGGQAVPVAMSILGGNREPPPPLEPPPPKKPLSRVNPSDQFNIQNALNNLPPELRQSFSQSFGVY